MRLSDRQIRIIGALMLAGGLAACAVSVFSEQLGLGAEEARGMFGWRRISLLVAGAVTAAIGAAFAAHPQVISRPEKRERIGRLFPYPTDVQLRYLAIGLLGLLGLVLVWTRLLNIGSSLWHDEAHTILNYSAVGLGPILFGEGDYSINNHVLYNLLSWATVGLLGESEAMYRFWSVVPGIAAIAVAAWWAWRRIGALAAVGFATLAVAASQHIDHAPQARGYGLVLLAGTLMLIAADRLTRAYSKRALAGFVGSGLVGIWTLHVFAVALIGQALALLKWPHLRRPVIVGVGLAGILSALFYAPVLAETVAESRPRGEGISLSSALLLDRPLAWFAVPGFTTLFELRPDQWTRLVALALVAFAVWALWRRQDFGLALILVAPPLFFNLFIAVTGLTTVPRHQFLLLTHVLLLVAIGITELGRLVAQYRPLRAVAVGAGVVLALGLAKGAVDTAKDESMPFENFQEAADVVEWASAGPVVTDSIRPDGLRYYLGDELIELHPRGLAILLCSRRQRELVYIRHVPVSPEAEDYRWPASLRCIPEDSVRVRVPQRTRGAAIDIWIINPQVNRYTVEDDLPLAPLPWIRRALEARPSFRPWSEDRPR
jgi:hypothetical protein